MNGTFIYLVGFAGCGKLTIAKAIQSRMDCIVVDNHHINNVIFALIDPDGKSKLPSKVWDNVLRVRAAALDTIRDLAKPKRSFVFTNELLESEPRAAEWFDEIAKLSRDRGASFFPVRLTIAPEELARRVVSPGRGERLKETNPESARAKAALSVVFKPRNCAYLDLDITAMTASEVADWIIHELDKSKLHG